MWTWITSLDCRCKAIAAILALVAMIASGAWALDARYAKTEDMVAQAHQMQRSLGDIKVGQLQSDRRALLREQFELENLKSQQNGKLTSFEQKRLQAIQEDIRELDRDIDALRKGK